MYLQYGSLQSLSRSLNGWSSLSHQQEYHAQEEQSRGWEFTPPFRKMSAPCAQFRAGLNFVLPHHLKAYHMARASSGLLDCS